MGQGFSLLCVPSSGGQLTSRHKKWRCLRLVLLVGVCLVLLGDGIGDNDIVPRFQLRNVNVSLRSDLAQSCPPASAAHEDHAGTVTGTLSCLHSVINCCNLHFKMQRQLNKSFYVRSFSYEPIDVKVSLKPYLSCIKSAVIVKIFHGICDPNAVAGLILSSCCLGARLCRAQLFFMSSMAV